MTVASETILVEFKVDADGAIQKVNQFKGSVEGVPASAGKATTGLGGLKNTMVALAPVALAAGLAIQKAGAFIGSSVQEAAAQDRIMGQLANSLANVGVSYNEVSGSIQDMFAHLQETTRFGDTDTAQVLNRLINTTGDYDASLKLLNATLDTAVAMDKDATMVAEALGRAVQGNVGALSRYGISLDDATKKQLAQASAAERAEILQKLLNEKFGGAAQAELNNYATQMSQLSNYYGDFKEAVGGVFTTFIENSNVIPNLIEVFKSLTEEVISLGKAMMVIANTDFDVLASTAADAFEGAFKVKLMNLYVRLSQLPGDLGAGYAQMAADIALELEKLGNGMDRALEPGIKAAEEWEKRIRGLLVNGVEPLKKQLPPATESFIKFGEQFKAFKPPVEALSEEYVELLEHMTYVLGGWGKFTIEADEATEAIEDQSRSVDVLQQSFSDLLGKGFMGELETFSDLWDAIWQDLAKSMMGILGDAFESAFSPSGSYNPTFMGAITNFWDDWTTKIENNRLGAGIAGVGMMYSGYQQGGSGGVIQGAMGGAQLGLSLIPGNVWAAVVGAIVGGLMGYFGGQNDTPATNALISLRPGETDLAQFWGNGVSFHNQGSGLEGLWVKDRLNEYRDAISEWTDILRLFEDSKLFKLIGDSPEWMSGTFEGTADQLAAFFRESWLPTAMKEMFRKAINRGLKGLGVDKETLQELWQELGQLTGADVGNQLRMFITNLIDTATLLKDMDWDAINADVNKDSFTAFMDFMTDISNAVDMQMLGLGDLSLLEQAEQAGKINDLITQAREAEIQYLRQLKQMQDQINNSIQQQIEGIQLGGMDQQTKTNWLVDRVNAIMADLADGVSSPEELAQLMAELQRYSGMLQSTMGEEFYTSGMDQRVIDALTWAQETSDEYFAAFRQEIKDGNQALIDQLQSIYDLLTNWSGADGTEGDTTSSEEKVTQVEVEVYGTASGTLNATIEVVPTALFAGFVRDVATSVYFEIERSRNGLS